MYDENNVFAKIIRKEIPATIVYEDDMTLAFHDVTPKAPVHLLVIPKGAYIDYEDFVTKATMAEVAGFFSSINKITHQLGLQEYRLINNRGQSAGQSVFHFHIHVLGGKEMKELDHI